MLIIIIFVLAYSDISNIIKINIIKIISDLLAGVRKFYEIQGLLLKTKVRKYRWLLRIGDTQNYHFTLIANNDDHRLFRMCSLNRYNAFDIEFHFGDLAAAVALEDGQLLEIVRHREMMAPRMQEINEVISAARMQMPVDHRRSAFILSEGNLHQVALESVIKEPIISEGMRDQDVRLVDRLDVPLLAPDVSLRLLLEITDLTEGRSEDNPSAKPAYGRQLDVYANPAALRDDDATNLGAVVVAQIYVTVQIHDSQ